MQNPVAALRGCFCPLSDFKLPAHPERLDLTVMSDVTRLIEAASSGDTQAANQLLPLVYDELRKLAAARLASEKPGQTLQATALVHEAYVRLVGSEPIKPGIVAGTSLPPPRKRCGEFSSSRPGAGAGSRHGGLHQRVDLDAITATSTTAPDELLAVDDALTAALEDAQAAEIIKLRYFAGFSTDEAGQLLNMSRSTAYEHWAYGRAWLRCRMQSESDEVTEEKNPV